MPLTVGLPPPEDRGFADVWSALGGELKPSIDVVVSAPVSTGQRFPVGPPVEAPPMFSFGGSGGFPGTERVSLMGEPASEGGQAVGGPDQRAGEDGDSDESSGQRRRAGKPAHSIGPAGGTDSGRVAMRRRGLTIKRTR